MRFRVLVITHEDDPDPRTTLDMVRTALDRHGLLYESLEVRSDDARTEEPRLDLLLAVGLSQARRLSHRPGLPTPDVEGYAALTACQDCGGYVCVDLMESDRPYGRAVSERCTQTHKRPLARFQ